MHLGGGICRYIEPHSVGSLSTWEGLGKTPTRLEVQGHPEAFQLLDLLPQNGLGIVGTRNPQAVQRKELMQFLEPLRGSRMVIISGLAVGVDTWAHGVALELGLPTLAVVAGGLDINYPSTNLRLREEIIHSNGLVLTEQERGVNPHPAYFLARNRIIAALSRAIWMVEAPSQSGALNTAQWCIDSGRDLYVTPCRPGDPRLSGNQKLLDEGHARAFWGAHSLGATWLELSSLCIERAPIRAPRADPLTRSLEMELTRRRWEGGKADLQSLLSWGMSQGHAPIEVINAYKELTTE